jgi:hypothetical protein
VREVFPGLRSPGNFPGILMIGEDRAQIASQELMELIPHFYAPGDH